MLFTLYDGLSLRDVAYHAYNVVDFGRLGHSARVQPIFHLLNELELYSFGLNPQYWYFSRLVLFLLFGLGVYYGVSRWTNPVAGTLLTLAILLPSYWSQVFLRLGVAECYIAAALGVCLALLSHNELESRASRALIATIYALAIVVILGSKEVMLCLLPAIALKAAWDFKARGIQSNRAWAGVFGIGFGLLIMWFIWSGLRSMETDIYGNSLSIMERINTLLSPEWLFHAPPIVFLLALVYQIIAYCVARLHGNQAPVNEALNSLGLTGALAVAFQGSVFFYNFNIPAGSHYEFPVRILELAALFIGTLGVIHIAFRIVPKLVCLRYLAAPAAAALVFTLVAKDSPLGSMRRESIQITAATRNFHDNFNQLLSVAKRSPDKTIEFVSHGFNDFEPVNSLLRFARGFGASNPIILNTSRILDKAPVPGWETYLKKLMLSIQANPENTLSFTAIRTSPPDPNHIIVYFSQHELAENAVANFWPMQP